MASNELAIRFTEETYATKAEVSRELRMSLIDNIWSNILKYRATYYRYLTLKSIDKNQLMVCYCQSVHNNINAMDSKLLRYLGDYMRLNRTNGDLSHFEDSCLIRCLHYVSRKNQLNMSDIQLRSLIQGDMKDLSLDKRILKRYLDSLRFIRENYSHAVDVDFLAELYSVFTENPELTSFYRNVDDNNPNNRVLIDRVYSSAPVYLIEGLMNSLFSFISTTSLSSVVKAIITYYFLIYIRPFPKDNEEIALLLAKAVISNGSLSEFGSVIPFENLLVLNQDSVYKVIVEVQKTNDLTYFINFILKAMEGAMEDVANIKANQVSDILRKDFYRPDPVEETPKPAPQPQPAPVQPKPVVEEAPKPQPVIEQPKPVVETPKPAPVVERPKPQPQPAPQVVPPTPVTHELAFSQIPQALDEKAAARLEEHLLEMDPSLKKGEAYFYARHCTMHMNYTIAQYKKALGCAYETARTSMEHLVELHYYRKDQVKNKFVYTPIKQQ